MQAPPLPASSAAEAGILWLGARPSRGVQLQGVRVPSEVRFGAAKVRFGAAKVRFGAAPEPRDGLETG